MVTRPHMYHRSRYTQRKTGIICHSKSRILVCRRTDTHQADAQRIQGAWHLHATMPTSALSKWRATTVVQSCDWSSLGLQPQGRVAHNVVLGASKLTRPGAGLLPTTLASIYSATSTVAVRRQQWAALTTL